MKYNYKYSLFSLISLLLSTALNAQIHILTVINGYGSGTFQTGDTVHVWSVEYDNTKTFSHWTGDFQYLKSPNEWHTTLVMPDHDIFIISEISNMPAYAINYEQIMGANTLKNVYSCFPTKFKGVIYLFHGTGGKASNWINTVEYRSFVNAAIADSFGIIATEAEEITLNTDLNGDGKLRWQGLPIDTLNGIDYLNIKIITDTFINRGNITSLTPVFSVGMSNGGSFSALISYIRNYQAGISYCASSIKGIFSLRNSPFAFRMAKYDDNEQVGPAGNYEAWQNDSTLEARGICHNFKIHDRQPIYPERFARIEGISVSVSQSIFNDLLINNQLDEDYYALHSDTIMNNVLAHPALYPNIIALSSSLRKEVLSQISTSNSEHSFYSDYNFETLDFIKNPCSPIVEINHISFEKNSLNIFPNPANTEIKLGFPEGEYCISIFNNLGQLVYYSSHLRGLSNIDLTDFSNGIYVIQATEMNRILISKFIKQ